MNGHCPDCGASLGARWDIDFTAADRAFFKSHPERTRYTRPAFNDEHPFACVGVAWIEVVRLGPGLRVRVPAELVH